MNLSEHFTLEEMTSSQVALRQHIKNTPTASALKNLASLAVVLEQIRALVGKPLHIDSGYRSPPLNRAVGGSSASAHMEGLAADITVNGIPSKELALLIRDSSIMFDQLIHEGQWVHVGLRVLPLRRQVMTARFKPSGTVYSEGIV